MCQERGHFHLVAPPAPMISSDDRGSRRDATLLRTSSRHAYYMRSSDGARALTGPGKAGEGEVGLVGRLLGDGIAHPLRVPLHKTYLLLYRILVECMTAGVEAQGARIRHVVTPLLIWKRESRSYGSMAAASSASTRRSRRFVNGDLHSFARSSILILY